MKILALIFALTMALPVFAQQTVLGTAYPCQTAANNTWVNIAFPAQTGNFELQFDASSSVAAGNMVLNLGGVASTSYTTSIINSRFYTNSTIQAENGSTYGAVNSLSYTANGLIHLTYDMNVSAKTFNLYAGVGTARTTIATNYAFRPGIAATSFAYLTINQASASPATGQVCNVTVLTYPTTTVTHQVQLKWNAATLPAGATAVTGYNVLKGTAAAGPFTQISTTNPNTLSYLDLNVVAGTTLWYTVQAVNSAGVSANATPVSTTIP